MSRRRPYVRSMDGWWRRNPRFMRYMAREGTSVFLAAYALVLLVGLLALSAGEQPYLAWLAAMGHPVAVVFHLLVLAAALYHTVTWFAVSPKAMPPIRIGANAVPPGLLIAGQYGAAAVISAVVLIAAWGG